MTSAAITVGDYVVAMGGGEFTPMQVLKLTYIAHGYTLAITGKPLFGDRIEAWKYGPVIPTLYNAIKEFGRSPIPRLYSCRTPVTSPDLKTRMDELGRMIGEPNRSIIDAVLKIYGSFAGFQLSNITHMEDTPWKTHNKPGKRHVKIPDGTIKEYYENEIKVMNQNARQ